MRNCRALCLVAGLIALACGSGASPSLTAPSPSASQTSVPPRSFAFLPPCSDAARPQFELDFAGLPPLVPDRALLRCLKMATTSGSAYDAGSDHVVELIDGHEVTLYEHRGQMPDKPAAATLQSGTRDIYGRSWQWATWANGSTTLTAMIGDTYVQVWTHGGASEVDELARVAATLQPVSTWPRPMARDLCEALAWPGMAKVAAAFDSTAAAMAKWEETPESPGGPHVTSSDWRKAPPDKIVTLCYLDGDFGPPHGPAALIPVSSGTPAAPTATPTPRPDYDRIVVEIGLDRRPIARLFGWRDTIAIRDPSK